MERPDISTISTGQELKRWYWSKAELILFARARGVRQAGSKFDVLDRLANDLDGKTTSEAGPKKPSSSTPRAKETLTLETVITDSYKNGENTRRFFKEHCGQDFSFSIPFMAWMKTNAGMKMKDAVAEWERLQKVRKEKKQVSVIPESNQYNQYIRDFFADNPNRTIVDARYYWKLKRKLPLGKHTYEKTDLELPDN